MSKRPEDLPDFGHPPLDEVAIAVQFKELDRFQSVHYGLLYEQFKQFFPRIEEHQPLSSKFETFGRASETSVPFEIQSRPPLRRVWLVSQDGHQLVQIQPDRFIHNWRKVGGEGTYPRFENIIPKFFQEIDALKKFLSKNDIGDLSINQCELSYFNNIYKSDKESVAGLFPKAFRFFGNPGIPEKAGLSRLEREAARFNLTYRVWAPDESEPIGRLHVDAAPATNTETGDELVRLVLVFRGRPIRADLSGIETTFFLGREAIVKAFASITTKEYHKTWQRKV